MSDSRIDFKDIAIFFSKKHIKVIFQLLKKEILLKIGFLGKNQIVSIIFNEQPNESLLAALKKQNFNSIFLPKNPYV